MQMENHLSIASASSFSSIPEYLNYINMSASKIYGGTDLPAVSDGSVASNWTRSLSEQGK
jgi:hypothetical protein